MIHRCADSDGGDQRPCALTPLFVSILSHFLMHTACFIAMGPLQDNLFVTLLVPLASTDDLLMHALLALSGAHMASQDPRNQDIARARDMHYAWLISGLRGEFGCLQEGDLAKKERLLCLLLVACHYEAVSGNVHGAFSRHLCASRHLAKSLVASRSMSAENDQLCHAPPFNSGLLGFSLELYIYTMLCSLGVHPPSTESVADLLVMPFEDMSKFPTFGALLFPYIRTLTASQHYVATLVWPVMIGASCITETEPQAFLMQEIRANWSSMGHVGMMADILQLLWDDPDPEAFGPQGLNMIMKKNDKTICLL